MLADEINELAVKARDGKLSSDEMRGGTSTISNVGSAQGLWFTPVINHPEVAILGIGRIEEKAVVRDGEIVAAPMLALSLSYDHRLVDGVTAQSALNHVKRLLNDPELIIMEDKNGSRRFRRRSRYTNSRFRSRGLCRGNPCSQLGQKVTIVEKGEIGGVCLNVGCIPSKALIQAGHRFHDAQHGSEDMGIATEKATVDFSKVQEWKAGVVKKLTGGVEGLLKGNKV